MVQIRNINKQALREIFVIFIKNNPNSNDKGRDRRVTVGYICWQKRELPSVQHPLDPANRRVVRSGHHSSASLRFAFLFIPEEAESSNSTCRRGVMGKGTNP